MTRPLKLQCKFNHELTRENIYIRPSGERSCRICRRAADRTRRRKAAAAQGRDFLLPPRKRTHCPKGHPFSGDNLVIKKDGRRGCRACNRETDKRRQREGGVTKRTITKVFNALHEGKTINNITLGMVGNTYVPGLRLLRSGQLKTFKKRYPKLGRRIDILAEKNAAEACQRGANKRRLIAARSLTSSAGETAFVAVIQATANLPDYIRDDVRSMMFVAVAEGRLHLRDAAARVREFVTSHNCQYSKYVPQGGGIMQSLDQQVYDDGPTTLGDTVTRGLWD